MEFVSFEIAQKLKEKGFSLPSGEVIGKYDSDGVYHSQLYVDFTETMNSEEIIAPTISQVLKWLREEKKIYVSIFIDDDSDCPVTYEIYKGTECMRTHHGEYFASNDWNKCELRAIEYVIDDLI